MFYNCVNLLFLTVVILCKAEDAPPESDMAACVSVDLSFMDGGQNENGTYSVQYSDGTYQEQDLNGTNPEKNENGTQYSNGTESKDSGQIVNEMDPTAMIGIYIDVLKQFCSLRVETMTCIRNVTKFSSKWLDGILMQMMIPDNIDAIYNYACSRLEVIEKHAMCGIEGMGNMTADPNSCFYKLQGQLAEYVNITYPTNTLTPGGVCTHVRPLAECVGQVANNCDPSLKDTVQTLATAVLDGCYSAKVLSLETIYPNGSIYSGGNNGGSSGEITQSGVEACFQILDFDNMDTIASELASEDPVIAALKIYLAYFKLVCSQKSRFMPCIRNVAQPYTNGIDGVMLRTMIPDNIDAIMSYACTRINVIEQHMMCGVMGVMVMVTDTNGCLIKTQGQLDHFMNTTDQSSLTPDAICTHLKPLATCLSQLADNCDPSFKETVKTLATAISKGCGSSEVLNMEQIAASGVEKMVANYRLIVPMILAFSAYFL